MTKIIIADIDKIPSKYFEELYDLLDFKKKIDGYLFEKDKKLSILSEICLYYLLSFELKYNKTILDKDYKKNGKPYFVNIQNINYSISHSKNKCIVGISDKSEIGLDIENIEEIRKNKLSKYLIKIFDKNEINKINLNCDNLKKSLILWTKKEAYYKSIGVGSFNQILNNPLNKEQDKSIITIISEDYIISIANLTEKIKINDLDDLKISNLISRIKNWKTK